MARATREATKRQLEVLEVLKRLIAEKGIPPTRHELTLAIGAKSDRTATDHLNALERKGLIKIYKDTPRGIRVV